MNNKFKKIALLGGDIIILYLSLYLTLLIRYSSKQLATSWAIHLWPFTIIFLLWLIIFYISNLYNLNLAINNLKFFQLSGKALAITGLISLAFFYLIPQINIAPKRNLFIFIVIFAVLFVLWRQFYNWSLKSYLPKSHLAIIGFNEQVQELINELQKKPHLGFIVSFIVDNNATDQSLNNIPLIKDIGQMKQLINKNKISNIILTADPHYSDNLRSALFDCLPLKINYISLPNFYEAITGKIPLDAINQMWFLENLNEGSKSWFNKIKRFYDFILAVLILLITLPFWLLIALIIKMESRGPVFIIMPRLGQDNKIFNLIKFRTMKEEGNDRSPTIANDPRITKFGSFLRKTRLDEVPQMINVIRGEMSFVGPRPERPELAEKLAEQITFYRERLLVKPGLTGSDQISGEYHSPIREDSLKKLQYDLFYIKNRSLYLDISIILKTIATVLSRKGV